jgi:outer membrane protein assembly factor BamB
MTRSSLFAIEVTTGEERWRATPGGLTWIAQPTVVGDRVLVGSRNDDAIGSLLGLDGETGAVLWRWAPGAFTSIDSPLIADGSGFVGTHSEEDVAHLFAIEIHTGGITVGTTVTVEDGGTMLRAAPSPVGVVVGELTGGTELVITGPSEERDGQVWWPVEVVESGLSGWVPAASLVVEA